MGPIWNGSKSGLLPEWFSGGLSRHVHTEAGALCLYLLVGLFFATVYGLVSQLQDGSFFVQTDHPDSTDFIYFSFITLTTTGYGDLTAAYPLGRSRR